MSLRSVRFDPLGEKGGGHGARRGRFGGSSFFCPCAVSKLSDSWFVPVRLQTKRGLAVRIFPLGGFEKRGLTNHGLSLCGFEKRGLAIRAFDLRGLKASGSVRFDPWGEMPDR